MTDWGQRAAERLSEIALASEPGPGVTRLPFTPEHRNALDLLGRWMNEAGLETRIDAAGTLIGRAEGPPGSRTFFVGSHQDSVREGGAFDGIMGIVLPILALQKLNGANQDLPCTIEVLAFADEEGVRFPTALMGPRALAGSFNNDALAMRDTHDISLRDAMTSFGLQPERLGTLRRDPADILGYLETHIEQGPTLERENQALGVVTAICGIERHELILTGETGHAGTLPMEGRRDALVGAAAVIAEVSRLANAVPDLRGTVGRCDVRPNVVNAVPRQVNLTIELRSPIDSIREKAGRDLQAFARDVAATNGLHCDIDRTYHQPAQPCDPALSEALAHAISSTGNATRLPSGATHDASAMADLCPIAMLFVRCRGGISHSPEEFAEARDLAAAVDAICTFLTALPRH